MDTELKVVLRRVLPLTILACLAVPVTAPAASGREEPSRHRDVARGDYLVSLLGCGRCHTEGYLIGNAPTGPHLAGSQVGIAYTDGKEGETPGLTFAPNLTSDDATGLGTWSRRDIIRALTTGVGADGHQRLPVMPWPNYAALNGEDLQAIAAYLKSLPPVRRVIPETTARGDSVEYPYVRFGIFVFTPFDDEDAQRTDGATRTRSR